VLSSVGLPEAVVAAAIPLVLPVDWIIGRARSVVNVMSDMLVAILLDRGPKEPEPSPQATPETV
jgi:Na+/H+-dicarboxylate symporter